MFKKIVAKNAHLATMWIFNFPGHSIGHSSLHPERGQSSAVEVTGRESIPITSVNAIHMHSAFNPGQPSKPRTCAADEVRPRMMQGSPPGKIVQMFQWSGWARPHYKASYKPGWPLTKILEGSGKEIPYKRVFSYQGISQKLQCSTNIFLYDYDFTFKSTWQIM